MHSVVDITILWTREFQKADTPENINLKLEVVDHSSKIWEKCRNWYNVKVGFMDYGLKKKLSGFFPWDLSVVIISPEWVTGPEQG